MLPLNILSASNGALMKARVPLDPLTLEPWELDNPETEGGTSIAGVPGRAPAIELELPLTLNAGAPPAGKVFSTSFDGVEVSKGGCSSRH